MSIGIDCIKKQAMGMVNRQKSKKGTFLKTVRGGGRSGRDVVKNIKIVGINGRYTHSCLALFYVRNELEKNCADVDVQLLQFTINDNYYETLLQLTASRPASIFFSAAIWNSTLIEKLALDLHQCLPGCRIVIGGPQAQVLRDKLEVDNTTFVIGEIEAVGGEFYLDLKADRLKRCYSGSFSPKQQRWFDFPYRQDDFADHLLNRHIYYESSRGCPFRCSYCLSAVEKGVFHKDIKTVELELLQILQHRPKVVRFIDRTFNDVADRALAIWRFLAENGGKTLFHFEIAPDRFSEEMFTFLEKMNPGRFQFEIGIQSTHPKTLEAVNRKTDPAVVLRNIGRLAEMGNIHLHVDLILGLPFETRDSFADSFRSVFAIGAHYIQMGLLKILPDTPLCHVAREYGYLSSKEPPYAVLENRWLDHAALSELYWFSECVEKFLNNRYFVTFWKHLRTRKVDIYRFFEMLLARCRREGFFSRGATQELMCHHLAGLVRDRDDSALLLELLRYDWLRCNHRFLPDCLLADGIFEQPQQTRSTLYRTMPAELAGVFTRNNRNQFFRKSFFLRVSAEAATILGFDPVQDGICLCFLPVRADGLFGFNKVLQLSVSGAPEKGVDQ